MIGNFLGIGVTVSAALQLPFGGVGENSLSADGFSELLYVSSASLCEVPLVVAEVVAGTFGNSKS